MSEQGGAGLTTEAMIVALALRLQLVQDILNIATGLPAVDVALAVEELIEELAERSEPSRIAVQSQPESEEDEMEGHDETQGVEETPDEQTVEGTPEGDAPLNEGDVTAADGLNDDVREGDEGDLPGDAAAGE